MMRKKGVLVIALATVAVLLLGATPALAWKAGAHVAVLRKTQEALPDGDPIKAAIAAYPGAAAWGANGPDLPAATWKFLYDGYAPWFDRFHYDRPGSLGKNMLTAALAEGDQEKIAFAAGWVTHEAGDLAAHGNYVNPAVGGDYLNAPDKRGDHRDAEAWADPYVWHYLGGYSESEYTWWEFSDYFKVPSSPDDWRPNSKVMDFAAQACEATWPDPQDTPSRPSAADFLDWMGLFDTSLDDPLQLPLSDMGFDNIDIIFTNASGLFGGATQAQQFLDISGRRASVDAAWSQSVNMSKELLEGASSGDYSAFSDAWMLDDGLRPRSNDRGEIANIFRFHIHTGGAWDADTEDDVYGRVVLADGSYVETKFDYTAGFPPGYDDFEQDDSDDYYIHPPGTVNLKDVVAVELRKDATWDDDWEPTWLFISVNGKPKPLTWDNGVPGNWYHNTSVISADHPTLHIPVDWAPPVTRMTASPNEGMYGWYLTPPTVTLTPDEAATVYYKIGNGPEQQYTGPFTMPDGVNKLTWRSVDAYSNEEVPCEHEFKVDSVAPEVGILTPLNGSSFILNSKVVADWWATDMTSGLRWTLGTSADGGALDTERVGAREFVVEAVDVAGQRTLVTNKYLVTYAFTLLTNNTTGTIDARLGSAVPLKFQIKDANGRIVSNATPKMYLKKEGASSEQAATSTIRGVTNNEVGYASKGALYSYSLNTKTLTKGNWQIRIEFVPGYSEYVPLVVR